MKTSSKISAWFDTSIPRVTVGTYKKESDWSITEILFKSCPCKNVSYKICVNGYI